MILDARVGSAWLCFLSLFAAMEVDGGRGRSGSATTACEGLIWSGGRGWSGQASHSSPDGGWRRGWDGGCSEVFLRRCASIGLFESGDVPEGSCGNQRSWAAIELRLSLGLWCAGSPSLRWSCGGAGVRDDRMVGMPCRRSLGFFRIFLLLRGLFALSPGQVSFGMFLLCACM